MKPSEIVALSLILIVVIGAPIVIVKVRSKLLNRKDKD